MRLRTYSSYTGEPGWSNPPHDRMGKGRKGQLCSSQLEFVTQYASILETWNLGVTHLNIVGFFFRVVANASIKTTHWMCVLPQELWYAASLRQLSFDLLVHYLVRTEPSLSLCLNPEMSLNSTKIWWRGMSTSQDNGTVWLGTMKPLTVFEDQGD